MSLGHTAQKPRPPLTVLLATELAGLLLLPREEGLSSFPAGTLALIRLSYPFSPLSAAKERLNPPQAMNNLWAGEKGKCRDPIQVCAKGKQGGK